MTTRYADIPTLPDSVIDEWGDVFDTKHSEELNGEDKSTVAEEPGVLSDVQPVVKTVRQVTWPNRLETQPYYTYKYYIQVIRELVKDMGLESTEKEIRQMAQNMWPKYSQKLNIAKEAAVHYEKHAKLNKEEVSEFGDEPRYLRREVRTGTWGNILNAPHVDSDLYDINWQPYYIYKYFMNVVREQSRLMGLNHEKEDIRRMGEKLWPSFSFKEFLTDRALLNYRREVKARSGDQDNKPTSEHETISEEQPGQMTRELHQTVEPSQSHDEMMDRYESQE